MRRPQLDGGSAGGTRGTEDHDDLDLDLDLDDAVPARSRTRPLTRPGGRRRGVLALAAGAVALTALLVTSVVRHEERAAALASSAAASAAAQDPALVAWRDQQQRSQAHAASEVAALSLLPEDLAYEQHSAQAALAGAAPRLVDLDWSLARTSTRRDGAAHTGDGHQALVDAVRFARTSSTLGGSEALGPSDGRPKAQAVRVPPADGSFLFVPATGDGPATGVGWRITTPLTPQDLGDACAVAGAVALPEAVGGAEPPVCRLQAFTSASGERQVLAVRTWETLVDAPQGAWPGRVLVGQQAVLVTDGRWAWSVAATAVGTPGTPASVPPMSLDEVVLAVRWLADVARGLPTPAPLDGTPLPGFSE